MACLGGVQSLFLTDFYFTSFAKAKGDFDFALDSPNEISNGLEFSKSGVTGVGALRLGYFWSFYKLEDIKFI